MIAITHTPTDGTSVGVLGVSCTGAKRDPASGIRRVLPGVADGRRTGRGVSDRRPAGSNTARWLS
jgi:hypothetical protein